MKITTRTIKREISYLNVLIFALGKLAIGIGIGIVLATKFLYIQPYWYVIFLVGAVLLLFSIHLLIKVSETAERSLIDSSKGSRKKSK